MDAESEIGCLLLLQLTFWSFVIGTLAGLFVGRFF